MLRNWRGRRFVNRLFPPRTSPILSLPHPMPPFAPKKPDRAREMLQRYWELDSRNFRRGRPLRGPVVFEGCSHTCQQNRILINTSQTHPLRAVFIGSCNYSSSFSAQVRRSKWSFHLLHHFLFQARCRSILDRANHRERRYQLLCRISHAHQSSPLMSIPCTWHSSFVQHRLLGLSLPV